MNPGFDINATSKPVYLDFFDVHQYAADAPTTNLMSPLELFVLLNEAEVVPNVTAVVTRAGFEQFSLRPSYEHQAWTSEALERITAYRKLRDGWDGEEGVAPSQGMLNAAENLALLLAAIAPEIRPQLSLDSLGRPTFARNVAGFYLHLTIDDASSITWFAEIKGIEYFRDLMPFSGRQLPSELLSLFDLALCA